MKLFLASSLRTEDGATLNPANGFVDELRRALPRRLKILYICSDPFSYEITDAYANDIFRCMRVAGFDPVSEIVLDGRNRENVSFYLRNADLIILAGGHVPTQNEFFRSIDLRSLIKDVDGVVLGTSAGSMNCADTVYAPPELEGEASSEDYKRFLPGLGLTRISILPHYHSVRDEVLDGLKVLEEIVIPDSKEREFIAIPDGSYLMSENGYETRIRGEAYLIKDGRLFALS